MNHSSKELDFYVYIAIIRHKHIAWAAIWRDLIFQNNIHTMSNIMKVNNMPMHAYSPAIDSYFDIKTYAQSTDYKIGNQV